MRRRSRRPLLLLAELDPDGVPAPLWDRRGPVDLSRLSLSDALRESIIEWADAVQSDPTDAEYERLCAVGRDHAQALAAELGQPVWFDDIVFEPQPATDEQRK